MACAACSIAGCFAIASQQTDQTPEIRMEQKTCFGTCPAYHVTLRANGTLTYDGTAYVKHVGRWTAKFDPRQFAELSRRADRLGFAKLKTDPLHEYDVQESTVSIASSAGTTRIHENGDGPKALHEIEKGIDEIIKSASHWKRLAPPTTRFVIEGDRDTAT